MTKPKRPTARDQIVADLQRLLHEANTFGLVVTVRQEPLQPLAMRNYQTVLEVRDKVVR